MAYLAYVLFAALGLGLGLELALGLGLEFGLGLGLGNIRVGIWVIPACVQELPPGSTCMDHPEIAWGTKLWGITYAQSSLTSSTVTLFQIDIAL